MSLLPTAQIPSISRSRAPLNARAANRTDAVLVIVAHDASARVFSELPEAQRWQELHSRATPRAGTVRSTSLANSRHTLAVVGYVRAQATAFERLSLAGRMLKETASRGVENIGLLALDRTTAAASLEALLAASLSQAFALPAFRAKSPDEKRINRIELFGDDEIDVRHAVASARGSNLTRWLTSMPPNKLDARGYKRVIGDLARDSGLTMRWLDEPTLKRLGANAFLAVSAGNADRNAGIAHLKYRPPRSKSGSAPDVALVGKGILFDTGGTNLKPHKSMLDMHIDMSGSAVALSTILALAELRAPFAVDAWLAITENRIGPTAFKPQDVVKAVNGVTIQVIHTDAEGRMVLADTLALASRTKPKLIIDYATLTGACVYALTERMSGVFTNKPEFADKLVAAGRESGERVWNFPFDADYDSDLDSKVADIVQCSVEGKGDHILATRFLSRFVPEDITWAHVDMSSVIRSGGLGHVNTDLTGFGVRYTLELLLRQGALE
jgi:leucyl aminopeptidase